MTNLKEKINMEIAKIPEDKISELYNIIHFYRIGIESENKKIKSKLSSAINYFGIWKDLSSEEIGVLEEIESRREKTFKERIM